MPVRKTRVLYVHPANQVKIATALDQPEYRPGGQASVQFTLTGKNGQPMPGALSLSAVDEAVFAVLEQATGTEQNFFSMQSDLLRPILQLYPWSPTGIVDEKAKGLDVFERALFARTMKDDFGNREALIRQLLPFVENNRRIFEVLDEPALDEWIQKGLVVPEKLALLRSGGEHNLMLSTYPKNVRDATVARETLNEVIRIIWTIGAVLAVLGLMYLAIRFVNASLLAILVGLGCLAMLFIFILSPVQRVRYASYRTQISNDMKQLDMALEGANLRKFDPMLQSPRAEGIVFAPSQEENHAQPRVRDWFPETLLWRPELITDERGRASVTIPLADSITTWRLTASAVTGEGRLGAARTQIKVFQPFFVDVNLPVALTRGDEVAVPVVVYNYLDKAQEVDLTLLDAPWFTRLEKSPARKLALGPNEVRSVHYRLRAGKVGVHELQVNAAGAVVADAVKRRVEVVPDGRPVETVWNGNLAQLVDLKLSVPADAIEGSAKLFVKLYPSRFSQLVEGLDGIFHMPSGCFEQTSSTTYPNVLALDYLKRTGKSMPTVEAKARQYIHLGYQRLVGFEVAGGGFDWFGRPPANRTLTAYGLMEFSDMAKVHDVDPNLIARTRKWLLDQRQPDGSWAPEGHVPANLPGGGLTGDAQARLSNSAYIAWAVFAGASADAGPTRQFLVAHEPAALHDPHALALIANALLAIDPSGRDARPFLDRLVALRKSSPDGKETWWPAAGRTTFHGSGRGGSVETTALATLALIRSGSEPALARTALAWLVQQRDGAGTWYSTQATVLALKALLAGTDALAKDAERRIELIFNGKKETVTIPADQAEVMKLIDLSADIAPGSHQLTLTESTATAPGYQVAFRYHVPGDQPKQDAPFAIAVHYDRDKLAVDETLAVQAKIVNTQKEAAPMVMVELPLPPGCVIVPDDFAELVEKNAIAKFEVQPRRVLVYLRELTAGQTLELRYRLRPTIAGQLAVAPARVYEYYNPERQASGTATRLNVTGRE